MTWTEDSDPVVRGEGGMTPIFTLPVELEEMGSPPYGEKRGEEGYDIV